jgi:hypothetical protein
VLDLHRDTVVSFDRTGQAPEPAVTEHCAHPGVLGQQLVQQLARGSHVMPPSAEHRVADRQTQRKNCPQGLTAVPFAAMPKVLAHVWQWPLNAGRTDNWKVVFKMPLAFLATVVVTVLYVVGTLLYIPLSLIPAFCLLLVLVLTSPVWFGAFIQRQLSRT